MKTIAFALLTFLFLTHPAMALSDDCGSDGKEDSISVGSPIDGATFFDGIKGNYKIMKAGGAEPHEPTQGSVELEPGQTVFTFSYCPPQGGCDPGYIFLEDGKTKVFQKTSANGGAQFTIQSVDGGKQVKFSWDVTADGLISLKNYQYVLPGGAVTTLEHTIRKMN